MSTKRPLSPSPVHAPMRTDEAATAKTTATLAEPPSLQIVTARLRYLHSVLSASAVHPLLDSISSLLNILPPSTPPLLLDSIVPDIAPSSLSAVSPLIDNVLSSAAAPTSADVAALNSAIVDLSLSFRQRGIPTACHPPHHHLHHLHTLSVSLAPTTDAISTIAQDLHRVLTSLPHLFSFLHALCNAPPTLLAIREALVSTLVNYKPPSPPPSSARAPIPDRRKYATLLTALNTLRVKLASKPLEPYPSTLHFLSFIDLVSTPLFRTTFSSNSLTLPSDQTLDTIVSSARSVKATHNVSVSARHLHGFTSVPLYDTAVEVSVVKCPPTDSEEALSFQHEVLLLRTLIHPCLPCFYGVHAYPPATLEPRPANTAQPSFLIVTEHLPHSLRSPTVRTALKSALSRLRILRDVAHAIRHLHCAQVRHCSITPTAVRLRVVDGVVQGRAKVDLTTLLKTAASRRLAPVAKEAAFSPQEVFDWSDEGCYTRDVWAFAMLVAFLFHEDVPSFDNSKAAIAAWDNDMPAFVEKVLAGVHHADCKQLMKDCLQIRPCERLSIGEVAQRMDALCEAEVKMTSLVTIETPAGAPTSDAVPKSVAVSALDAVPTPAPEPATAPLPGTAGKPTSDSPSTSVVTPTHVAHPSSTGPLRSVAAPISTSNICTANNTSTASPTSAALGKSAAQCADDGIYSEDEVLDSGNGNDDLHAPRFTQRSGQAFFPFHPKSGSSMSSGKRGGGLQPFQPQAMRSARINPAGSSTVLDPTITAKIASTDKQGSVQQRAATVDPPTSEGSIVLSNMPHAQEFAAKQTVTPTAPIMSISKSSGEVAASSERSAAMQTASSQAANSSQFHTNTLSHISGIPSVRFPSQAAPQDANIQEKAPAQPSLFHAVPAIENVPRPSLTSEQPVGTAVVPHSEENGNVRTDGFSNSNGAATTKSSAEETRAIPSCALASQNVISKGDLGGTSENATPRRTPGVLSHDVQPPHIPQKSTKTSSEVQGGSSGEKPSGTLPKSKSNTAPLRENEEVASIPVIDLDSSSPEIDNNICLDLNRRGPLESCKAASSPRNRPHCTGLKRQVRPFDKDCDSEELDKDEDVPVRPRRRPRTVAPSSSEEEDTVTMASAQQKKNRAIRNLDADAINIQGEKCLLGDGVPQDLKRAVAFFSEAAEANCIVAHFNLANCLEHGRGVDIDTDEADKHFLLAAKGGHREAQVKVAMRREGIDSEMDQKSCFHWYNEAAKNGAPIALYKVGMRYEHGEGVEKNEEAAFKSYLAAAEKDNMDAVFALGKMFENGCGTNVDKQQALNRYDQAARKQHQGAMLKLGNFYRNGQLVEQDHKMAYSYFVQASRVNGADAAQGFFLAGQCLENGEGVTKNTDKALEYYENASNRGHEEGAFRASKIILSRDGGKAELSKAVDLLKDLARRGHREAMFRLGECAEHGRGMSKGKPTDVLRYYQKAARMGSAEACVSAGLLYENGQVKGSRSEENAAEFYEKGRSLGSVRGIGLLGQCYTMGYGKPMNVEKGIALFREGVSKGDALSMQELGDCYRHGIGLEVDPIEACRYYEQAASLDHSESQVRLAECLLQGLGVDKDVERALALMEKAISQKCGDAYRLKGDLYLEGKDVEKDVTEAMKNYRKAHDLDNTSAMVSLGSIFETGANGTVDKKRALQLYKKAGDRNNALALNNMGVMHEKGDGVKQSYAKAVSFYQKGMNCGSVEAISNLADCHMNGNGVVKDVARAIELYREAADLGDMPAKTELGKCYLDSIGVEKDVGKGMKLLEEASKGEEAEAMRRLGLALTDGVDVEAEAERGLQLIHRAAELGNREANVDMGRCLYFGRGTSRDAKEAAVWFQRAMEHGNPTATTYLSNMYFQGEGVPLDYERALNLSVETHKQLVAECERSMVSPTSVHNSNTSNANN